MLCWLLTAPLTALRSRMCFTILPVRSLFRRDAQSTEAMTDRHVSYSAIELAFRLCPLAQQQEEREAFLMRLFPDSLFVNAAPQARARFASMKAVEVPNKGQQLLDFLALDDLSRYVELASPKEARLTVSDVHRAQRFTGRIQFGDEEAATVATSSRSQKSKIPFYLGRDGIQAVILARAPLLMSFEEEEHEEARLSIAFDSIVKTSLHGSATPSTI